MERMLKNNILGGNMTPEEAEKAKSRAKQEIEVFSIYLEQAIDTFGSMLSPQEVFLAAGITYLGAGQTDIHAAVEGLYEQIQ
ncbi:phage protein [Streptococcus equi subsp. equi]|nr:phage protein [Streptococcus equi subsp. equi]